MFFKRKNVLAWHDNISNAYVKTEKDDHLDTYMKVPKEMIRMDKKCLSLGAKATNDLALLVKSRYMVESRPGDFGVYYLIRSAGHVSVLQSQRRKMHGGWCLCW